MNAQQIKDEIRKLSRIDKIEIYRWIDEEAAADLLSRIGVQGDHSEKRIKPTVDDNLRAIDIETGYAQCPPGRPMRPKGWGAKWINCFPRRGDQHKV